MRNFLKKSLKLFLVFTIIFTDSSIISFGNEIEEVIDPPPKIRMGGDGNAVVQAGKETTIEIPIINTVQSYAYNLLIQATPETNAPFTINFLNNSNRKYVIERVGSTTAVISVNVDKNAPPGIYPVKLEFSYTSESKESLNNYDTFYIKVENKDSSPSVVLNDFSVSKNQVSLGEEFEISAVLENTTMLDAKNLSLEILGLDTTNITLVGSTNTMYIENFQGTTKKDLAFKLATTSKTPIGANQLEFKITYKDTTGNQYERSFKYYVNVSQNEINSNSNLDLKITELTSPQNTLGVNQSGTFSMTIKNDGDTEAKNVKITAIIPEGLVPTTSNIVVLSSIPAGQEKPVSFSVAPTSDASTQAYSVGFSVEYNVSSSEEDKTMSFQQYAGVNVNNPEKDSDDKEDENSSTPKIIITKYTTTPIIVEAGKDFELEMTFQNSHSSKSVQNIKVYLTVEDKTEEKGSVFSPNNSSTTFYIDNIAPKGEVSHTFYLYTVPDAKAMTYTINVNFEYEDANAKEYNSTEIVGVNVKQQSKLETSDIEITEYGYIGEPIYVNFQIYNTGKVTLSNLKVEFIGDGFSTSDSSSFFGNLDTGATEYYDGRFTPMEIGEQTITLKISYEDTDGQIIEQMQDYTIFVDDFLYEDAFSEMDDYDFSEKGVNIKTIIIVIIVVIILAIGIFLFLKKKTRLKKEFDFDE